MYNALGKVYEAEGNLSQAGKCHEKALAFITTWLTFGYDEYNRGYFQREGLSVQDLPMEIFWQGMGKGK